MNRYVLYADLDQRLVDGSVIWLLNFAKALSRQIKDGTLYVLFKMPSASSSGSADASRHLNLLSDSVEIELGTLANVQAIYPDSVSDVIDGAREGINSGSIVDAVNAVETQHGRMRRIFCRGYDACRALLSSDDLGERVVVYWTYAERFDYELHDPLLRLCRSRQCVVLTQSQAGKHYLEVFGQLSAHRVRVVPPIVDESFRREGGLATAREFDRSVCYFGKIDREYGIEQLLALAEYSDLRVTIYEGKLTKSKTDPGFLTSYVDSIERIPELSVHRGVPHGEMARHLVAHSFAFCIRSSVYDSSSEISTKLLEACSLGVPPLLSRTKLNVAVFGEDYPLLFDVDSETLVEDIRARVVGMSDEEYRDVISRCMRIAQAFHSGFMSSLDSVIGTRTTDSAKSLPEVILASHDTKFLDKAIPEIRERGISIHLDEWETTNSPVVSRDEFVFSADTVFCEWCCGQAVWFSNNKSDGQRLIVRLHRFEMFGKHVEQVNWDAVDWLIVVNHQFKRDLVSRFTIKPEKIVVFPQYICSGELGRQKHAHSDYCIGMVGINPFFHKRFDRAVRILDRLRRRDPRFRLRVRSVMPWSIEWVWKSRPAERQKYIELFELIDEKELWPFITFDDPGSDMEEWYRNVDILLSCSETEGCHTALMEGMSSGCFPVVFDWPGARDMFPGDYVVESVDDAVSLLEAAYAPERGERPEVRELMAEYDYLRFVDLVENLILEDRCE